MTQFLGASIGDVPYWMQLPYEELEYIIKLKQKHNNPESPNAKGDTWVASESEEEKFLRKNLSPDQLKELNIK